MAISSINPSDASLLQTCKRHGVESWAYLRAIISRIPAQPADKLDELLPGLWQANQIKKKNQDAHKATFATAESAPTAAEKSAAKKRGPEISKGFRPEPRTTRTLPESK